MSDILGLVPVEESNEGASFYDILLGLGTKAAEGAIDKEFNPVSQPATSAPRAENALNVDTAIGEQKANRNEIFGTPVQQLLTVGGIGLGVILAGVLIYKVAK